MSVQETLSSESLATTTTFERAVVIERPNESIKRQAKERLADKIELGKSFLERYEGGMLRKFYEHCGGDKWHVDSWFNKDYIEVEIEEDIEEGKSNDEVEDAEPEFRR